MARNNIDILVNGEWNGRNEIRKAERDIEGLEKAVDNTGRSTSFLDGAIGGLVGGALVAFSDTLLDAAFAAREYAQESILLAQSAEETTSLLQFSLGPAYDGFIERLDETSEATGRSRAALEEQSSTFIAMTKTAGFAADEAADISASLANIGLDLGSFFNQDSEQVFGDLQSALAGSSETLQKYGIDVRDTALRAAALEAGIIEANRPLTQQERILAILSEVQRQAADAMGDATRTADSATNQSRKLEDAYADLQRAIGKDLLPVQEELTALQLEFIQDVGPEIVSQVGDLAKGLSDILIIYRDAKNEFEGGFFDQLLGFSRGETETELQKILTFLNPSTFLGKQVQQLFGWDPDSLAARADAIRLQEEQANQLVEIRDLQSLYNSSLDTGTVKIAAVTEETQRAYSSQRDYLRVIREQTDAGQAYFDSLEEKRRLEEAQAAVAERAAEAQRQLGGAFLESLETINSLETPEDPLGLKSFNDPVAASVPDLLFQVGQQAGLAAPQMAALALATGDYSREQINAALEAAIMEEAIGRLAEDVATGKTTIDEAELELIQLQEELRNSDPVIFNTASEVSGLNEELAKVDGDRTATVNVQINGLEDLERAVQLAERIGAGRVLTPDDPLVQKALAGRTVRQLSPSTTDDANSQGSWR